MLGCLYRSLSMVATAAMRCLFLGADGPVFAGCAGTSREGARGRCDADASVHRPSARSGARAGGSDSTKSRRAAAPEAKLSHLLNKSQSHSAPHYLDRPPPQQATPRLLTLDNRGATRLVSQTSLHSIALGLRSSDTMTDPSASASASASGSAPPSTALVVGAGLVGALSAAMLANRGFTVTVIEARADPRQQAETGTSGARARSINLALSPRGIEALRSVSESLVERVLKEGIEMRGRMLHKKAKKGGVEKEAQDYGYYDEGECIRSISRTTLGNYLLDHLETLGSNVKVEFGAKLVEMDLRRDEQGTEVAIAMSQAGERRETFELVVGADGAYSRVRREMMRGSKARSVANTERWSSNECGLLAGQEPSGAG